MSAEQEKKGMTETAKETLAAVGEKAKETYQAATAKIGEVNILTIIL